MDARTLCIFYSRSTDSGIIIVNYIKYTSLIVPFSSESFVLRSLIQKRKD